MSCSKPRRRVGESTGLHLRATPLLSSFAYIVAAFFCSLSFGAEETVTVLPANIDLTGPQAAQRILVQHRVDGNLHGPVDVPPKFTVTTPGVVEIRDGQVVAVGNGETELHVSTPDGVATAQVRVSAVDQPFEWTFRNHVLSVMAKAGCNSGACHGAAAGQGGFRLSLRGYDPKGDFHQITRQTRGRRIVPSDPGRSLLLLKPTQTLPHKGGERFTSDSLEYRVLAQWIAAGTPPPSTTDALITELEIFPKTVILQPGAEQQVIVRAHFSDGHIEDVTPWAKYTATVTGTAQIDGKGKVTIVGHGESAITAWYLSRIATATVTVPFSPDDAPELAEAPARNFIDHLVTEKLRSLRIPSSGPATDHEFLRRAHLDTTGVLPTAAETKGFLDDPAPSRQKRDQLIDALLERPEFVDYWSYKWSDLLLVNSRRLGNAAMWAYYAWIRNRVEANTPWDDFTRQLVTSTGSALENGATNFFVLHQDPREMAETTSVAFLGLSINCAKCHNHPLEKWTNNQYYGMANLFSRVRTKKDEGGGHNMIYTATSGELIQPLTGEPQPPRPLDGMAIDFAETQDRRLHLADWLVDRKNPYFSRAISNRVWANFMGVGLVEKVDDLRVTNPASNEKLLSALADYLADKGFNLKSLMRAILRSNTYQRSSRATKANAADTRYYSRYYSRRLKAEVLLDAFSQVTGVPTQFGDYPKGWRALQLPDSNINSYFLSSFGRPDREQTCECERTAEPSVAQVLHITNGSTLNDKLAAESNHLTKSVDSGKSAEKLVEDAYLRALSRRPSKKEREGIAKIIAAANDKRLALEDLYWSVVSTKEFLFNH